MLKCREYECRNGHACCFDCEDNDYCNFRCKKWDELEFAVECENVVECDDAFYVRFEKEE